jgi:predicted permease
MGRWFRRLAYLFRRRRMDAELREEMEFHRSLLARGSGPVHRTLGEGGFGNAILAEEDARSIWIAGRLERLIQDVRYGARALWRARSFTCVAALTLALGIGGSAVMFSVVDGVLLRPLPYRDADRIAMLWTVDPARGLREGGTSFPTVTDWRARARSFTDIAIWRGLAANVAGADAPERVAGALVSANTFNLLGVSARVGRTFTAADEERRAQVIVLSHRLWQRRFGGAADAVGKTLEIDGRPFEIVGVMPEGFYFPTKEVQFWEPSRLYGLALAKPLAVERTWENRYNDLWRVVGRLRAGVDVRDAQAEMSAIGRRLAETHASPSPDFLGFGVEVVPMLVQVTGRNLQLALWVLLGSVGFVLLIACVNVANLLLARGVSREREFAVRAALGASRVRMLRQLIVENSLLGVTAGALGVGLAAGGIRLLTHSAASVIPRLDEVTLDGRVLLFAAAASLVASILFGTAPAWRLAAGQAGDALRQSGAATGAPSTRSLRRLLVIAECALAVVLLAGAGLLVRSLSQVRAVKPGFDTSRVLLVRVNLPLPMSPQWRRQEWSMFQDIEARVAAIPGVERVGMIQDFLTTANPEEAITIEGEATAISDTLLSVTDTTPGFFDAMGVPLRAGRFFTAQEPNSPVAIVNESFARRFFAGQDAVGKRFKEGAPGSKGAWYTIVGIVGDMHRQGLERDPLPEYYYCSSEPTMDLAVRTRGNPSAMTPAVREAVRAVYRNAVILHAATVEDTLGGLSAQRRFQTSLLSLFAGIALALAAVGIYGIVHFAVAQRTQEIGIRMALGARPLDVMRLVVGQGMALPAAGTALGLSGALSLTRVLRHLLFQVTPIDPLTFAAVAALLITVAVPACWIPARRALRVDPLAALRHE